MSTSICEIYPTTEIFAQLQRLRQNLLCCGRSAREISRYSRQGVLIALGFIQEFLKDTYGPNDPKPLVILPQLIYALHDLDNGTTRPLLSPKQVRHRAPDPFASKGFRAFGAVAMELFMEGKVGRLEAARRVAKDLNHRGYCNAGHKPITAKNVENWRYSLRAGSPKDLAVERFRRLRDHAASSDPIALAIKIQRSPARRASARFLKNPPC